MTQWTPPSPSNPFRAGDIVVFRNRGSVPSFEVDHVEANMVFIRSTNGAGKTKLVDYSANEFMLLSDWKRIYANG